MYCLLVGLVDKLVNNSLGVVCDLCVCFVMMSFYSSSAMLVLAVRLLLLAVIKARQEALEEAQHTHRYSYYA